MTPARIAAIEAYHRDLADRIDGLKRRIERQATTETTRDEFDLANMQAEHGRLTDLLAALAEKTAAHERDLADAVAREREACLQAVMAAKPAVEPDSIDPWDAGWHEAVDAYEEYAAAAIRARGGCGMKYEIHHDLSDHSLWLNVYTDVNEPQPAVDRLKIGSMNDFREMVRVLTKELTFLEFQTERFDAEIAALKSRSTP